MVGGGGWRGEGGGRESGGGWAAELGAEALGGGAGAAGLGAEMLAGSEDGLEAGLHPLDFALEDGGVPEPGIGRLGHGLSRRWRDTSR